MGGMELQELTMKRSYLEWQIPGTDRSDRVELLPANMREPDGHLSRTASEFTIPAGATLRWVVVDEDPLLA